MEIGYIRLKCIKNLIFQSMSLVDFQYQIYRSFYIIILYILYMYKFSNTLCLMILYSYKITLRFMEYFKAYEWVTASFLHKT